MALLLTLRQRQVIHLVGKGCTYDQAAERLGISARTVEDHATAARDRAGLLDQTPLRACIILHYTCPGLSGGGGGEAPLG